jgi:hypothetical protein
MKLDTIWTQRNEVKEQRLAICKGCEFFVEKTAKCESCGCFMNYKALLPNAKCPLGKWNNESQ